MIGAMGGVAGSDYAAVRRSRFRFAGDVARLVAGDPAKRSEARPFSDPSARTIEAYRP
jgi:hypothetical protein